MAHGGSRGIALFFHDRSTGRGWVVSIVPRPLFTSGKYPVPVVQEAGWAPGPVWTGAENLAPTGIRSQTIQPVASSYTDWATGPTSREMLIVNIQGLSKRFELWPPRSPDLTTCDFFLWGYVKDNAYKLPLPQNVRELQDRIRAAVQTIDGNMLKRVWQELDYRIDICRVTRGAHIEHLWADFGKLGHLHYLCVKLYLILTINT